MDKNNRVLVAIILLIFVTLLSFNLDTISGSTIRDSDKPSVTISPKVVEEGSGQRVKVEVITGKFGVNERAYLYDHNSRVATTNSVCNDNVEKTNRHYKCLGDAKSPVTFYFSLATSLPPGIYNICVEDYEKEQDQKEKGDYSLQRGFVCDSFTIREKFKSEREIL